MFGRFCQMPVARFPGSMAGPPLASRARMSKTGAMRTGFAGLGLMGKPMATNLLRSGVELTVFNRSHAAAAALERQGATIAPDADGLFDSRDAVILMLADDEATDAALGRGDGFLAKGCGQAHRQHGNPFANLFSAAGNGRRIRRRPFCRSAGLRIAGSRDRGPTLWRCWPELDRR